MFTAAGKSALGTLPTYIEDVFSTWLYTGTGATQTITNGIDLSGKGGLVWIKNRVDGALWHCLYDTVRGATKQIYSNRTEAQDTEATSLTAFNTNGFSLGSYIATNTNGNAHASWTFRKQAKFFDVVTYTGNGASNRGIPHNLGSTPGFILVKATSTTGDWYALHRVGNSGSWGVGTLNSTGTFSAPNPSFWGNGTTFTAPTSTTFTVSADGGNLTNGSGVTFVAYLFAHDAGGFGAAGTDNVISCGSYTGDGAATKNITINYEPQWVLVKNASAATNWLVIDQMRGMPAGTDNSALLNPNLSNAESSNNRVNTLSATGFLVQGPAAETNASGNTYIYIAIRRGPMRTPTSGTSVFTPQTYTGNGTTRTLNTSITIDLAAIINTNRNSSTTNAFFSRLQGSSIYLNSNATSAEVSDGTSLTSFAVQTGYSLGIGGVTNGNTSPYISLNFRRAPGFFDVVCYSGDSTLGRAIQHNLAAIPELMIVKNRNNTENWVAYSSTLGNTKYLIFNSTAASGTRAIWANTTPTSTNFYVGGSGVLGETNFSSYTYVAYLFATVAGVSKVGSYAGSGILQTIPCGFASGARFVLIKRTDATGDWYVWDSARGITSGNDPYLLLNSTAAEVTNTNYVDTASTGFQVTAAAPAGLNAVGGNYIFLAIA